MKNSIGMEYTTIEKIEYHIEWIIFHKFDTKIDNEKQRQQINALIVTVKYI